MRLASWSAAALLAAVCACAARADEPPPFLPDCSASAEAPWPAAGAGYRALATTDGASCPEAHLTLALVTPAGRALWERDFGGAAAVRVLYGVPGGREMAVELEAWLTQGGSKPATAADLPPWPDGASGPAGFEPEPAMGRADYAALRAGARPLFCFAEAPGFDTCVVLETDESVAVIGRRATR
jgi:hypothetical protein